MKSLFPAAVAFFVLGFPVCAAEDEARERIEIVRRAAEDGLFDFALEEAKILASKAAFPYPDEAGVLMLRCHVELAQYDKAATLFKRIEREYPDSKHLSEAKYWYARSLLGKAAVPGADRAALFDEAVALLRVLARRSTDKLLTARANLYLGISLCESRQPAEAVETLNKAVRDLPGSERAVLSLHLSRAYQALQKYDEALSALAGSVEETAPVGLRRNGYYQRGEIHYALGRWQEAMEDYNKVLALNKGEASDELDFRAHYGLGWVLSKTYDEVSVKDPNLLTRAIAEMETAAKSQYSQLQRPARIKLAHLLTAAGRGAEARDLLYPLLEDPAAVLQAAYVLSQIEESQGNVSAAASVLDRAVERASGEAAAVLLVRLAELKERSGDLEAAISALDNLRKHLKSGPIAAQAAFDKARLLVLTGQSSKAIEVLDGIEKHPQTALYVPPEEMLYWRGRIRLSIASQTRRPEDISKAEPLLRTYLERHPTGTHRADAISGLVELYLMAVDTEASRRGAGFLEGLVEKGNLPPELALKVHSARAAILSSIGDHSAAARAHRAAASGAGTAERQRFLLSAAQEFFKAGLLQDAADALADTDVAGLDAEGVVRYRNQEAALKHSLGQFDAAAKAFEKLAESASEPATRVRALLAAASENLDAGKVEKAGLSLDAARKALPAAAMAPAEPVVTTTPDGAGRKDAALELQYHLLAARFALTRGDALSTKESAERALALAPDSGTAAAAGMFLGKGLRLLGNMREAAEAFETAAGRAEGRARLESLVEGGEAALLAGALASSRRMFLTAYYEALHNSAEKETSEKALRGAIEASIALAADETNAGKRGEILDGAEQLVAKCEDSDWKRLKAGRIRSLR